MKKLAVSAITLTLTLISSIAYPQPVNATTSGTGLSLYYKSDASWTRPPAAFNTSTCHTSTGTIDFNWGGGGPGGSCPVDNFTGYGVGYILAPVTGTVTFCEQTDDQFYLKIAGNLIIDDNTAKAAATGQSCNGTGTVSMVAGTSYLIETWMHEQGGGAEWRLLWSYSGQSSYVIVPITNLNPTSFTVADATPPAFTSGSSFSIAENISTSASAATIRVSESATVSISSGVDAAQFNIFFSDSTTAIIKFKVSPNFEAPSDNGANNVYNLTLAATDGSANVGNQAITITVTDLMDVLLFNSLSLPGSTQVATYRASILISANVTVPAQVTFRNNGKVVPGCIKRSTTGSAPNIIATCAWRPSNRGAVTLSATALANEEGIASTSSIPVVIQVRNRTGLR